MAPFKIQKVQPSVYSSIHQPASSDLGIFLALIRAPLFSRSIAKPYGTTSTRNLVLQLHFTYHPISISIRPLSSSLLILRLMIFFCRWLLLKLWPMTTHSAAHKHHSSFVLADFSVDRFIIVLRLPDDIIDLHYVCVWDRHTKIPPTWKKGGSVPSIDVESLWNT